MTDEREYTISNEIPIHWWGRYFKFFRQIWYSPIWQATTVNIGRKRLLPENVKMDKLLGWGLFITATLIFIYILVVFGPGTQDIKNPHQYRQFLENSAANHVFQFCARFSMLLSILTVFTGMFRSTSTPAMVVCSDEKDPILATLLTNQEILFGKSWGRWTFLNALVLIPFINIAFLLALLILALPLFGSVSESIIEFEGYYGGFDKIAIICISAALITTVLPLFFHLLSADMTMLRRTSGFNGTLIAFIISALMLEISWIVSRLLIWISLLTEEYIYTEFVKEANFPTQVGSVSAESMLTFALVYLAFFLIEVFLSLRRIRFLRCG